MNEYRIWALYSLLLSDKVAEQNKLYFRYLKSRPNPDTETAVISFAWAKKLLEINKKGGSDVDNIEIYSDNYIKDLKKEEEISKLKTEARTWKKQLEFEKTMKHHDIAVGIKLKILGLEQQIKELIFSK